MRILSYRLIFIFTLAFLSFYHQKADSQLLDERIARKWVFDPQPIENLRKSSRKVFAHYFSPFPISIDNREPDKDYYSRNYMSINGEKGKHKKYGGYLRQRPLPRNPIQDPNWRKLDLMWEIKQAIHIGLDGFSYDILNFQGLQWEILIDMLDAAKNVDPGFKIMLMPDMNGWFKQYPEALVPAIMKVSHHPSVFRDNQGRVVIAPFNAHNRPPSWWRSVIDQLQRKGIDIMFLPLFQGWWKYAEDYADISHGFSDWGGGTVQNVLNANRSTSPQKSHSWGKIWMAPIRPQDFRPKHFVAFEASNSTLFHMMWKNAIEGDADWAQIITWNDYSEATEIAPSTETNYAFYDLAAYYISWFKAGVSPQIKRGRDLLLLQNPSN